MSFKEFKEKITEEALNFAKLDPAKPVRIISHLDADGICSASIAMKMLSRENRKYSVSIISQLNRQRIKEFKEEDYECYLFTDLGSGQINDISEIMTEKEIFILDHHKLSKFEFLENIHHINPHQFGIDGAKEISGSGVTYLFSKELNEKNKELAYLAVIGSIGDLQIGEEISEINSKILQEAMDSGEIIKKKTLNIFGLESKPLYKALQYSDLLPFLENSESKTIQFLKTIGIEPKEGFRWKKISDLTEEEKEDLIAAIIVSRRNNNQDDNIFSDALIIAKETNEFIRHAREFATVLNACGRLNKENIGLGACLRNKEDIQKIRDVLTDYRREIAKGLQWYDEKKGSKSIIDKENYLIVNAKDEILHTIIGTILSIKAKSSDIKKGKILVGLARDKENNEIKVSTRIAGKENGEEIDLREIMKKIIKDFDFDAEAGGHKRAAGAIIPLDKEVEFLENAVKILDEIDIKNE